MTLMGNEIFLYWTISNLGTSFIRKKQNSTERVKRQAIEWENMFAIHLSTKNSQPEYIKTPKTPIFLEKLEKWPSNHFTKEDLQMTPKHTKNSSI